MLMQTGAQPQIVIQDNGGVAGQGGESLKKSKAENG